MRPHAWASWLESENVRQILWRGKKHLKLAWQADQEDPKSYPINTSLALSELRVEVEECEHKKKVSKFLPDLKKPKTVDELIPPALVKTIWDENHSVSFEKAIGMAADADYRNQKKSWKIFQAIIHAMETAYLVQCWGWVMLPRPKVNILHTGLNTIAKAAGLGDLKPEGFAQFMDDLCPCGLKQHKEAIRKSGSRVDKMRRKKS